MPLHAEDLQHEGLLTPNFPPSDRPASWANLYWDIGFPHPYEYRVSGEANCPVMTSTDGHMPSLSNRTVYGSAVDGGASSCGREHIGSIQAVSPLPHSLSRRISLDVLHLIVRYLDSELDRSAIDLVCRDWLRYLGSHHHTDLALHDAKASQMLRGCQAWSKRTQGRLRQTTTLRIHPRFASKVVSVCNAIFIFLGPCLPALRHLALESCMQWPVHNCFYKGLRLHCKGIRSLCISDLRGVTFAKLRCIILACPKLDTLSLRGIRKRDLGKPLAKPQVASSKPQSQGPDLQLRQLELCWLPRSLYEPLVLWLAETDEGRCTLEHTTHLTISDICRPELADLSTQLLRAIGPALRHLCIVRYRDELRGALSASSHS